MIQKGAGKPVLNYSPETAVHFLVEGANRVHGGKEILQEIAGKPLESKDNAKERAYEYTGISSNFSRRGWVNSALKRSRSKTR